MRISFKPNDKTRFYLSRLQLIDGKTGRKTNSTENNISEFINQCVVFAIEHGYNPIDAISTKQLENFYIKYLIRIKQKQADKLHEEMKLLSKKLTREKNENK